VCVCVMRVRLYVCMCVCVCVCVCLHIYNCTLISTFSQIGLDALYEIKETVEVLGGTIKAMTEGKINDAVNLVMGSGALIRYDT
jgi:hypothetical protein